MKYKQCFLKSDILEKNTSCNLSVKETSCFKSRPTYMHTRPSKSAYTKVCSPHYMKYIVHYSEGSNNKCNWAPSLDFSIIKVAWLMCTKRPDNYTLPTMKRETARDMKIKYSKDSNVYCVSFVCWPIEPTRWAGMRALVCNICFCFGQSSSWGLL